MSEKKCHRCSAIFQRPERISAAQWAGRRYCSKSCSARRLAVGDDEIVARYLAGESSTEIASCLGVSGVHIARIVRAAGVTRSASEGKRLSHSKPEVRRKLAAASSGRRHREEAKEKLRAIVGPAHHSWRAGMSLTVSGYIGFTASPANGVHAGRLLHQVIAEWKIGRALRKGEHVHHVDGDKLNNDPSNLVVLTASEHARLHHRQFKQEKFNAESM